MGGKGSERPFGLSTVNSGRGMTQLVNMGDVEQSSAEFGPAPGTDTQYALVRVD